MLAHLYDMGVDSFNEIVAESIAADQGFECKDTTVIQLKRKLDRVEELSKALHAKVKTLWRGLTIAMRREEERTSLLGTD